MKKSPELPLPAGGLERMQTAFDFGADAVYAGSPRSSLRAYPHELDNGQLGQLVVAGAQGIARAARAHGMCALFDSGLHAWTAPGGARRLGWYL